ncbi:MAG: metallophosphoesterase [Anaerolineaceae bacterium]|nr:metallophosphoesterase [Anaerolineaceae bacterium]
MSFSFIQITDHHLGESEIDFPYGYPSIRTFRLVMRHIAENVLGDADFIVTTGDIVNMPSDKAYQFLRRLLNITENAPSPGPYAVTLDGLQEFPMYFLPGNHDDRKTFIRNLFPYSPNLSWMNFAFEHKGIQFICLDWGAEDRAVVHPEMLLFLSEALGSEKPCILLMHHNVVPLGTEWLDHFIAEDVGRFTSILDGKNILGIFCGHLHSSYERSLNGIPVFGLRSTAFQFKWDGKPVLTISSPHYRVVTINDGALSTEVVEVPLPDEIVKLAGEMFQK